MTEIEEDPSGKDISVELADENILSAVSESLTEVIAAGNGVSVLTDDEPQDASADGDLTLLLLGWGGALFCIGLIFTIWRRSRASE